MWHWGTGTFGSNGRNVANDGPNTPTQIGTLTNWLQVSAGNYWACAVKTDGTLWAWGRNNYGELGLGNTTGYSSPKQIGALTNWLSIAATYPNTAAIKTDGTLWTWGRNTDGYSLGQSNTTDRSSPVQVGALTTWLSVAANRYSTASIKT